MVSCQYVLARLEFDPMLVQFVPALRAFLDGPAKALVDDGLLAIEVRERDKRGRQEATAAWRPACLTGLCGGCVVGLQRRQGVRPNLQLFAEGQKTPGEVVR